METAKVTCSYEIYTDGPANEINTRARKQSYMCSSWTPFQLLFPLPPLRQRRLLLYSTVAFCRIYRVYFSATGALAGGAFSRVTQSSHEPT